MNASATARNVETFTSFRRLLAEESFVLSVGEGSLGGLNSALYDFFRVGDGKLAEHWNTIEKIAPRTEWRNDNGKF